MIRFRAVGSSSLLTPLVEQLSSCEPVDSDGPADLVLVGTTRLVTAWALLDGLAEQDRRRAVLVGLYDSLSRSPPGSFTALLEDCQPLGAMPLERVSQWDHYGFVGRDDLVAAMNLASMKRFQSRSFGSWEGLDRYKDAGAFLVRLALANRELAI